jgi:flagellar basal-body rod protein FlgC
MGFLSDFNISADGLSAQRTRINVISSNIANAQTTRTEEGGPYRRKEVIFKAVNFKNTLNDQLAQGANPASAYAPQAQQQSNNGTMGVEVSKIVRDDSPFKMKYDPSNPDANAKGYVAYPNINPVVEMSDLVEATRSYQANVAAFQSAKNMATSAISLLQ